MFVEDTAWRTPWAAKVLPVIVTLCEARADRTCFTRFLPADHPGDGRGMWKTYWRRWATMTRETLEPGMVDLAQPLGRFVSQALVFDKRLYSPWVGADLDATLRRSGVDTLVITGAETDVCVLATVMGGIDLGYRIIIVTDGVCSSSDETHDALMALYHRRFSLQVETATSAEVLDAWS